MPYVAAEFASAGLFSPDERHFALVGAGSTWPRNVRFAGTDLVFDTPWGGECAVPFPPPGPVLALPPRA